VRIAFGIRGTEVPFHLSSTIATEPETTIDSKTSDYCARTATLARRTIEGATFGEAGMMIKVRIERCYPDPSSPGDVTGSRGGLKSCCPLVGAWGFESLPGHARYVKSVGQPLFWLIENRILCCVPSSNLNVMNVPGLYRPLPINATVGPALAHTSRVGTYDKGAKSTRSTRLSVGAKPSKWRNLRPTETSADASTCSSRSR
jgi:hypothetical protein